jgi:hypothetical protein
VDRLTTEVIWEESIVIYFMVYPGIFLDGQKKFRKIFSILLEITSTDLPKTSQTFYRLALLSLCLRSYVFTCTVHTYNFTITIT